MCAIATEDRAVASTDNQSPQLSRQLRRFDPSYHPTCAARCRNRSQHGRVPTSIAAHPASSDRTLRKRAQLWCRSVVFDSPWRYRKDGASDPNGWNWLGCSPSHRRAFLQQFVALALFCSFSTRERNDFGGLIGPFRAPTMRVDLAAAKFRFAIWADRQQGLAAENTPATVLTKLKLFLRTHDESASFALDPFERGLKQFDSALKISCDAVGGTNHG